MTKFRVDASRDAPPSRQIVEAVLDAVASGVLVPEAKLLSVREMAAEALVNHNTVARAYRDLEQLGVVEGHNGLGVFVTCEAVRIARRLRHAATLAAFENALDQALRSGHALDDLLDRMQPRKKGKA